MIRKATLNDIPAISELYREQFREMAKLIPDFIKEGDQSVEFLEKRFLTMIPIFLFTKATVQLLVLFCFRQRKDLILTLFFPVSIVT